MSDCTIIRGDAVATMRKLRGRSIDVAITDPPYSQHVHENHRSQKMRTDDRGAASGADVRRNVDLGFEYLGQALRRQVAIELARVVRRWILVFTDHEGGQAWRDELEAAGAEFIRFGIWNKIGCTPQFSGDRPANGHEVIVICHGYRGKGGGRTRWNGGGLPARWDVPIVLNRGGNEPRVHTTQKPEGLMRLLVSQFSDPGETVLDPFAGSGTTIVAAKQTGRKGLGVERNSRWAAIAKERVDGAQPLLDYSHEQQALPFGDDPGPAPTVGRDQPSGDEAISDGGDGGRGGDGDLGSAGVAGGCDCGG